MTQETTKTTKPNIQATYTHKRISPQELQALLLPQLCFAISMYQLNLLE